MILGYHLTFGTYGFWLPNDPRGSWSQYVGSQKLYELGGATKVSTRSSLAKVPHDHQQRQAAKEALTFPPVIFSDEQIQAVAAGFTVAIQEGNYLCHACAIMPQHVHLVLARDSREIKQIVAHLKARATQSLKYQGLWTSEGQSPWAKRRGWCVFLDNLLAMQNAIRYVERNPLKDDLPRQIWKFVQPLGRGLLAE